MKLLSAHPRAPAKEAPDNGDTLAPILIMMFATPGSIRLFILPEPIGF